MGLLDFQQPTTGMGGLLADPATTLFASLLGPGNAGANLARGIASAQAQAQSQKESQLKGLLYGAQIDRYSADAAKDKAVAEGAARLAAARAAGYGGPLPGVGLPQADLGGPAPSPGAGPAAPAMQGGGAMTSGQSMMPQIDVRALLAAGEDPARIAKAFEAFNGGRQKVARTVDTTDAQGRPVTLQIDEFGQPVGSGLSQWKAPVSVGQGDRNTFIDPVTLKPLTSFGINQSADSKASTGLGYANLSLSKQRLAMDQQNSVVDRNIKGAPSGFRWAGDGSLEPIPGGPAAGGAKLGEGAKKQVAGIDALGGAIDEYTSQLKDWGNLSMLRPDKRAEMGTKYNNMMLQAKEAYNLGVLNGPDYSILTSIVADPLTAKGALISNDALTKQATELKRIMGKVRSSVVDAHISPQNVPQQGPATSPGMPSSDAIAAELARRRGGAR